VASRASQIESGPFTGDVELWCKWSNAPKLSNAVKASYPAWLDRVVVR